MARIDKGRALDRSSQSSQRSVMFAINAVLRWQGSAKKNRQNTLEGGLSDSMGAGPARILWACRGDKM
ncbi:hypothetical protein M378DRAFT_160086 [Amanita muscaria Koide BX008]|uniref:Uncharacterized protein n=1 Tax=Amanita muscaria (strain Koide BX008) TaxID=946122 RepID=A0A0C2WZ66_AMAMK|nr:hypothetical protein M378DRAFT_160086 [Amanita muscaria Koide BX008]